MKKYFLSIVLLISLNDAFAQKKIHLSCNISDAIIKMNGEIIGNGTADIVLTWQKKCATVSAEKTGYVTHSKEFCNTDPTKSFQFILLKDESYDASSQSDKANNDFQILVKKGMTETDAWKLISQIITDKFDVIEVSDKETGYLRTSWVLQSFNTKTIRTRLIVKLSDTDPLSYKVKIVSEFADGSGVSIQKDELYKSWDRILRKYEELIPDLQSRLGT